MKQDLVTFNKPLLGLLAAGFSILMWSAAPLLIAPATAMPPWFLVATTLLAAALVVMPMSQRHQHRSKRLSGHWEWILQALVPALILGAIGSFVLAIGSEAGGQTALITYTWPVLFILMLEGLHRRQLSARGLLGAATAFAGAALLAGPDLLRNVGEISPGGYLLAAVAALSWALYSMIGRLTPVPLTAILPRLCLTAAATALLMHMLFERGEAQGDPVALAAALALGAGPYGLAMVTWDYALRQAPPITVGTLAYGVPVLSSVLMLAGGLVSPDWRLPVAGGLVMVGCVIAGRNRQRHQGTAGQSSDRNRPDQRRSGFKV